MVVSTILTILTAIPSLLTAYKTVKGLNDNPDSAVLPRGRLSADIRSAELNAFKKATAMTILEETLLPTIEKRGGNEDDLSTLIDFACFVYKMVRFKKQSRK